MKAMASISTRAPNGNLLTSTQDRTGQSEAKAVNKIKIMNTTPSKIYEVKKCIYHYCKPLRNPHTHQNLVSKHLL